MECDIGWEIHHTGSAWAARNPPLTIPVQFGQHLVTALLDTASSMSMMWAHLVPEGLPTLWWTTVSGMHHQLHQWSAVCMTLCYNNRAQALDMLMAEELLFPVLLSSNAPSFADEQPSTSGEPPNEEPSQTTWAFDTVFLQAQREAETLSCLRSDVVVSEGTVVYQQRAARYPWLEVRQGGL